MTSEGTAPVASVIIPAHNEATSIARTLDTLLATAAPGELEVVVVCNGCTDATASVAAARPGVRVIEIAEPSKAAAVEEGNARAAAFPRLHLDADVEISTESVRALLAALSGTVIATAPRRVVPREGCSRAVRAYYDVWERLPQVRSGLFGRGVFALTDVAQARVSALPRVMSDDLAVSEAFTADEVAIVPDATVVVRPPKRLGDLVRRRVRVATGNAQADQLGVRSPGSATTVATLGRLVREEPRLALRMPVFLGVTLIARRRAAAAVERGDFTTWQRDDSSRTP